MKFSKEDIVEKPTKKMKEETYPQMLESIIRMLKLLNDDFNSVTYNKEYHCIYNLLMVCVVNDT